MIVYSSTKEKFNDDVIANRIPDIIPENMRDKKVAGGSEAEFRSRQNSLHFMRDVMDDPEIAKDVQAAIEYQIPKTSRRVDFMIAGADEKDRNNVIVIERKQWDKAEKVDGTQCPLPYAASSIVSFPLYSAGLHSDCEAGI